MAEFLAAFSTGLLATISPCVLPLYPGFLAYLGGHGREGRQPANTFVLGIFVLLGVLSMMIALGALIAALQVSVGRALVFITPLAYVVLIVLGALLLTGRNVFSWVATIQVPVLRNPYASAFVYGVLYGPIALPCSGPLLVSIFALSLTVGEFVRQLALFGIFGLGFGLPLLVLAALGRVRQRQMIGFLVRYERPFQYISGVLLIAIGLFGFWESRDALALYLGW
ncbi:MAG: cytochrome c biogenesis protein CcdA [Ardenticatenia bacterium]|nr:MAG: cytochrome c biogenesis protein CcdA [Ardenticatenia bacterium]